MNQCWKDDIFENEASAKAKKSACTLTSPIQPKDLNKLYKVAFD